MAADKMSRTMMFLQILFKSLRVRKSRVAVVFLSIMIGAAVISALLSVYFDISLKMSRELRTYGANFFVGSKAHSGSKTIDDNTIEAIFEEVPAEELVGATPYLYGVVRLDLGKAVLAGVDFPGLRKLSPYWQVEGAWVSVDFDEENCMVGASLAKNMELGVGSKVNVINRETGFRKALTVKGIAETGQAEDEQVFVNLSLARKILGLEDEANHVMMSIVAENMDIDELAATIERKHEGIDARPIRKVSHSEGEILDKIRGLMALVAIIILSVTALCVMATLIAIVSEGSREIGLMKALGIENRSIVAQFLSETGIIGLAAVVTGLIVGYILAQVTGQAVFGSSISLRLSVLPLTLAITMAAALVASVIPVRIAVGIVPAQVLKGDE